MVVNLSDNVAGGCRPGPRLTPAKAVWSLISRTRHNLRMPNIASALRAEISRIARKEIRGEIQSLKKAATSHRLAIAELKRRVQALEQQLRSLSRRQPKPVAAVESDASSDLRRFSAKGLASLRRRLGLSAREFGQLIGASSQSVYNWEEGKARPRDHYLGAVGALRGMGKKEVAARLEALAESA